MNGNQLFNSASQIAQAQQLTAQTAQLQVGQQNGGYQQAFGNCFCGYGHICQNCVERNAQLQRGQAQASQWQNPRFSGEPTFTKENDMERNSTDRATALECLRLAINHDMASTTETTADAVVSTAEAFFSFVTGQPAASVADLAIDAVSKALKGE